EHQPELGQVPWQHASPGVLPRYLAEFGLVLVKMFESLSGVQVAPGFGADWSSHMIMPYQKAGWSWKFHVLPVPSCVGGATGSVGSRNVLTALLPEPGTVE